MSDMQIRFGRHRHEPLRTVKLVCNEIGKSLSAISDANGGEPVLRHLEENGGGDVETNRTFS
jgi:hypothetical protein